MIERFKISKQFTFIPLNSGLSIDSKSIIPFWPIHRIAKKSLFLLCRKLTWM